MSPCISPHQGTKSVEPISKYSRIHIVTCCLGVQTQSSDSHVYFNHKINVESSNSNNGISILVLKLEISSAASYKNVVNYCYVWSFPRLHVEVEDTDSIYSAAVCSIHPMINKLVGF